MGARISFTNHIHIAEKSFDNGLLRYIGYKDITPDMIEEIARDSRIQRVQIDRELPKEAYRICQKSGWKRICVMIKTPLIWNIYANFPR